MDFEATSTSLRTGATSHTGSAEREPLDSRASRASATNAKIAGITISVSTVAEIIPPTIGAAMRRMTSEPVPLLHMIGSSPAMIATTVIIFGRTR